MTCGAHARFNGRCWTCRVRAGVGNLPIPTFRHVPVGQCKCGLAFLSRELHTHVPGTKPVPLGVQPCPCGERSPHG